MRRINQAYNESRTPATPRRNLGALAAERRARSARRQRCSIRSTARSSGPARCKATSFRPSADARTDVCPAGHSRTAPSASKVTPRFADRRCRRLAKLREPHPRDRHPQLSRSPQFSDAAWATRRVLPQRRVHGARLAPAFAAAGIS